MRHYMDQRTSLPDIGNSPVQVIDQAHDRVYTLEKEIGRGSNAICYLASYEAPGRHLCLLKELQPLDGQLMADGQKSPNSNKRGCLGQNGAVLSESVVPALARIWQQACQDFIRSYQINCQLYEILSADRNRTAGVRGLFFANQTVYEELDYHYGLNLGHLLASGQPVGVRQAILLIHAVLVALERFHAAGYLYLDLAPGNVFLLDSLDQPRALLIDFSALIHQDELAAGRRPSGYTPGYESPELHQACAGMLQAEPQKKQPAALSFADDLYAVGAMLYQLLDQNRSTPGYNAWYDLKRSGCAFLRGHTLYPPVRARLQALLARALAPQPERYRSCREFMNDCREMLLLIDGLAGISREVLWQQSCEFLQKYIGQRQIRIEPNMLAHLETDPTPDSDEPPLVRSLRRYWAEGCQAVQLLGPGGAGKSYALLSATLHLTQQQSHQATVPIYLKLNQCQAGSAGSLYDLIWRHYFTAQHLTQWLKQNPGHTPAQPLQNLFEKSIRRSRPDYLLLLDGINEIDQDTINLISPTIQEWLQYPGVMVVLSSRSELAKMGDTALLNFRRLDLLPLNERQIQSVIRDYPPGLANLLQYPFYLSLYRQALLFEPGRVASDKAPLSAGMLMNRYLHNQILKKIHHLESHAGPAERARTYYGVRQLLPFVASQMVIDDRRWINTRELDNWTRTCLSAHRLLDPLLTDAFPELNGLDWDTPLNSHTDQNRPSPVRWLAQIVSREYAWVIYDQESRQMSFAHDHLRDFLAAVHLLNLTRLLVCQAEAARIDEQTADLDWSLELSFYPQDILDLYRECLPEYFPSASDEYTWIGMIRELTGNALVRRRVPHVCAELGRCLVMIRQSDILKAADPAAKAAMRSQLLAELLDLSAIIPLDHLDPLSYVDDLCEIAGLLRDGIRPAFSDIRPPTADAAESAGEAGLRYAEKAVAILEQVLRTEDSHSGISATTFGRRRDRWQESGEGHLPASRYFNGYNQIGKAYLKEFEQLDNWLLSERIRSKAGSLPDYQPAINLTPDRLAPILDSQAAHEPDAQLNLQINQSGRNRQVLSVRRSFLQDLSRHYLMLARQYHSAPTLNLLAFIEESIQDDRPVNERDYRAAFTDYLASAKIPGKFQSYAQMKLAQLICQGKIDIREPMTSGAPAAEKILAADPSRPVSPAALELARHYASLAARDNRNYAYYYWGQALEALPADQDTHIRYLAEAMQNYRLQLEQYPDNLPARLGLLKLQLDPQLDPFDLPGRSTADIQSNLRLISVAFTRQYDDLQAPRHMDRWKPRPDMLLANLQAGRRAAGRPCSELAAVCQSTPEIMNGITAVCQLIDQMERQIRPLMTTY